MAQFLTDFSEYIDGSVPHDWTEQWVVGNQTLEVVRVEGATGGKVLRHQIWQHSRRAWAWTSVPRASEVEVVGRMRASSVDSRLGLIARGSGLGTKRGGEVGWTAEIDFHGQRFRTCSYDPAQDPRPDRPHGNGLIFGESRFHWRAGSWYWIRMRLSERNGFVAAQSKLWADGDQEPETWAHRDDRTDPSHLGHGGFVGITGQTTEGVRDFDILGVGTDGDGAAVS